MTCDGGGATEKPRSAAIERASDIPPIRLRGFFPTQVVSPPIDIGTQSDNLGQRQSRKRLKFYSSNSLILNSEIEN